MNTAVLVGIAVAVLVGVVVWRAGPIVEVGERRGPPGVGVQRRSIRRWTVPVSRLALAGLTAIGLVLGPLDVAILIGCGAGVVALRRLSIARMARSAAADTAVEALTMLEVCLSGGLGIVESISMMARLEPDTPWARPAAALRRGEPFASAVSLTPPHLSALGRVAGMLAQAHEDGGSVLDIVRRQRIDFAEDLALQRAERAQRLSVWMLLPLTMCILPALVIVVVIPIALDGATRLDLPF